MPTHIEGDIYQFKNGRYARKNPNGMFTIIKKPDNIKSKLLPIPEEPPKLERQDATYKEKKEEKEI